MVQIVRADLIRLEDWSPFDAGGLVHASTRAIFGVPLGSPPLLGWEDDTEWLPPRPEEAYADTVRLEWIEPLSDLEALEAVQKETETIRPVTGTWSYEHSIPLALGVMWTELAVALVRARKPSAANRAAQVARSFVVPPSTEGEIKAHGDHDMFLSGSLLRGIAAAEIFSGSLDDADELLVAAYEQDGEEARFAELPYQPPWPLTHELLLAAHLWATGEHDSADRYLERIITRMEFRAYPTNEIRDRVRSLRYA